MKVGLVSLPQHFVPAFDDARLHYFVALVKSHLTYHAHLESSSEAVQQGGREGPILVHAHDHSLLPRIENVGEAHLKQLGHIETVCRVPDDEVLGSLRLCLQLCHVTVQLGHESVEVGARLGLSVQHLLTELALLEHALHFE